MIVAVVGATAWLQAAAVQGADVTGSGPRSSQRLFEGWAAAYRAETGNGVTYQVSDCDTRLARWWARSTGFCVIEAPLSGAEPSRSGLIQFPVVVGSVVPVVNLRGIESGQLKLTGPVLADIYLGRIASWNDRAIAELNRGIVLPDLNITVVRRSDASAATRLWTDYLSDVSPDWTQKVGAGMAVHWPEGVGGRGDHGVASYVQRIKGAIGYVDLSYAKRSSLAQVSVRNRDGHFVQPDHTTVQRAAAPANWRQATGRRQLAVNQPGERSWPITGASFVAIDARAESAATRLAALDFLVWAMKRGQSVALELGYAPMPEAVVTLVDEELNARIQDPRVKAIRR